VQFHSRPLAARAFRTCPDTAPWAIRLGCLKPGGGGEKPTLGAGEPHWPTATYFGGLVESCQVENAGNDTVLKPRRRLAEPPDSVGAGGEVHPWAGLISR
jgi:hypothetical protein